MTRNDKRHSPASSDPARVAGRTESRGVIRGPFSQLTDILFTAVYRTLFILRANS